MDAASALERARQGMQFIAIGSDLRLMTLKAQEMLQALRAEEAAEGAVSY